MISIPAHVYIAMVCSNNVVNEPNNDQIAAFI